MKIIPTSLHGAFDYICGFVLIFSPGLFGFSEIDGPQRLLPQLAGFFILVQSVMTRYECGVLRVLRMATHVRNESLVALLLALSPWVFDFHVGSTAKWSTPHFVVGMVLLIGCLLTREQPRATFEPAV